MKILKTNIYTYKNKKPVFYELQRFYKVKTKDQLSVLIEELLNLDIDAVITPSEEDLQFPAVLELKAGFGLTLEEVRVKKIKREIGYLKSLVG
jgi:hypothetical protein